MSIRNACAVGVVVLNEKNEVLLQKRGDDHTWTIPGGGMEVGESTQETAVREVWEETGLEVFDLKLLNVYSGKSQYHKYPDGNEYYFVNIVYLTDKYRGKLTVDNIETVELQFYNVERMPANLASTNRVILSDIRTAIIDKTDS